MSLSSVNDVQNAPPEIGSRGFSHVARAGPLGRHDVELPHDVPVVGVERVHVADDAGDVTAGVADVDESVRGDRRHGKRDARTSDVERAIPNRLAGPGVDRQHVHVGRPAKELAVHVSESAIHAQRARRLAVTHDLPLLGAVAPSIA